MSILVLKDARDIPLFQRIEGVEEIRFVTPENNRAPCFSGSSKLEIADKEKAYIGDSWIDVARVMSNLGLVHDLYLDLTFAQQFVPEEKQKNT